MTSPRAMVIAVASGKGGTGKTTVAAHLAVASARSRETLLVDLDVEAPDASGYFPDAKTREPPSSIHVLVPLLIAERCTGCGLCAASCRFGAILAIGGVVTIDEGLCKGCGRCVAACHSSALAEVAVEVGRSSLMIAGDFRILEGRLSVGDTRSTTVIEAIKRQAGKIASKIQVRDCPPGVTCPATHAIEGADYVVLVAEPTRFSLHDLGAAIALAKGLGIPLGVVVNKDGFGDADVDAFCEARNVPIVGRIAFLLSRAETGSAAKLWTTDALFMQEMERILARASEEGRKAARP